MFNNFSFAGHLTEIHTTLQSKFPDCRILDPPDSMEVILAENIKTFLFIWAIFAICTAFFCILQRNLLETCKYSFSVFKTVGASRFQLIVILLLQNAFIFGTAFVLAALVHISCYPFFDRQLNILPHIPYNGADYLYIFVVLLILTAIVDFPFARNYIVKNAVDLSKSP